MLHWLWPSKSLKEQRRKASDLYGAVVTQARQPALYADLGVPDTPTGRYEMIVLHLVLVLDRLAVEGTEDGETRRLLIETFVTDLDDTMREMGVGDLAVPKRVKRATGALYERLARYREPLASGAAGPLSEILIETAYAGRPPQPMDAAHRLAQYALEARAALAAQRAEDLRSGRVRFVPVGAA